MRFLLVIALSLPTFVSADSFIGHGYSLHGSLKYGPDFTHFDYTNPNAPKGGEIRLSSTGTFDSLNPFIMKGLKAPGIGLIYDTLMKSAADEVASEYGLLTQSIEVSNNQSWAIYTLNPQARWHDGKPVTSEDVVFSFNVMMEEGHPYFRSYYASVEKVEQIDKYRVKFVFGEETNRELPFIVGQLTVLPKHYWKDREFGETSF